MSESTTWGVLAVAGLALSGPAFAQTPSILIREDDPLGPAGQIITGFDMADANNAGGFAVGVTTTDSVTTLDHYWGNATGGGSGALLLTESTSVAGFEQTAFESTFGFSDSGSLCIGPTLTDIMTMTTGIDGVWVDSTPILNEGENPITEPMIVSRFNSRPNMIASTGEPVWIGGMDDMGGTDIGRRLYRGAGHTVVLQSGPAPAPLVATIPNGGIDFDFQFSAGGSHYIAPIDTDLPSAADAFLVIDGALATTCNGTLIGEGEAIPLESGGLAGENWDQFDTVGINENGDFMICGDTDGPTGTDEFVSLNGNIVLREGDVVMDLGGGMHTLSGSIEYSVLNEDGDILTIWDDDTGAEVMLLNGVVILSEFDEVDWDNDGMLDAGFVVDDFEGSQGGGLSPRSGGMVTVWAQIDVFNPNVMDEREGVLEITVDPGTPFSGACVGSFRSLCNGDGGDGMGCTDCPCGNNAMSGTVGGCLNSAGTSTQLDATGSASISLPAMDTTDLRFTASGSPPTATNVLLSGAAVAPQSMANPCFGLNSGAQAADRDGLRCAVQSVVRHGNRSADAMGNIADSAGPSRVWGGEAQPNAGIGVQGGFMAGQTRYFQITHRDDAMMVCMRGLNTSQAVEVTFTP